VTDRWIDRLSEYVDGSLEAGEALALEAHLAECAECAATLAGLRAVTARAAALPPREPARDLWPEIAARLAPRSAERPSLAVALATALRGFFASLTVRRLSLSLPQLAAAALALVLVSGGAVWIAFRARPTPAPAPAPVALQPAPAPEAASVGFAQYDAAIAELERALSARRASLDTSTVRVVEQNLATIDRAIAEARRALAADPTDPYLHDHLANTMRRKMGLLRRLTTAAYST
jgi:anti-sigma factor RsiW